MTEPMAPSYEVLSDGTHLFGLSDEARLEITVIKHRPGALLTEAVAKLGQDRVVNRGTIDLLNLQDRERFVRAAAAVDGVVPWNNVLLFALEHVLTSLATAPSNATGTGSAKPQPTLEPGAVWHQAQTAHDFLLQDEPDVSASAKDLVVPGCITVISAPRSSGKSLGALHLGVALATGGIFRDEHLTQRRVFLVDRDNPPSLVRKRLRCFGAQHVTWFRLLTRDKAPPLTDKTAWERFPVEDFDVVMIDSIGAATEGVSEKEGRQTQEFLATLKDLARRGPALLCLDNTNKDRRDRLAKLPQPTTPEEIPVFLAEQDQAQQEIARAAKEVAALQQMAAEYRAIVDQCRAAVERLQVRARALARDILPRLQGDLPVLRKELVEVQREAERRLMGGPPTGGGCGACDCGEA